MLEAKNVVKTFDGFRALDGLTMTVAKGAVYGLVGPNGAGKSTIIRHLTGILGRNRRRRIIHLGGQYVVSYHLFGVGHAHNSISRSGSSLTSSSVLGKCSESTAPIRPTAAAMPAAGRPARTSSTSATIASPQRSGATLAWIA